VQVAWTQLVGEQPSLHGLQSDYALNYPSENLHATWSAALGHVITVTNSVAVVKRYQQVDVKAWNANAYPVWNAGLTHDEGRIRPYLRLSNLSNTGYEELDGVAVQGRAITGGISLWLGR
jgi:iron complex outermembrane receptor protein